MAGGNPGHGLERHDVFGENPGPVEAVVGQMAEFEVTASGYPIPVVQLQSTTASANSYDVDAGYCVYEPPWEDIGTQTFMFTASNSLGVATQVVSVYVTEAAPDAPASVWASATNATDFTAAWSAVSNATSYRLDVATHATFSGGGGGADGAIGGAGRVTCGAAAGCAGFSGDASISPAVSISRIVAPTRIASPISPMRATIVPPTGLSSSTVALSVMKAATG